MSNAIDRIKVYCCEVTQEQWEELVKVADKVGCPVDENSRRKGTELGRYQLAGERRGKLYTDKRFDGNIIPFPDFLAKLRGVEEWTPKAGEMVEVEVCGRWFKSEVVAFHEGQYVCQMPAHIEYIPYPITHLRPLRPTITRAEAEQKLGKRIID